MNVIDCALLKNCVLIRLKTTCWANSRKLDVPQKAVEAIMDEADKTKVDGSPEFEEERKKRLTELQKRVKGSKTLITADEYDAIASYLAQARTDILKRYVVPSFLDDGLYAVKQEALGGLEKDIEKVQKQLQGSLIPAFQGVYAAKVKEAADLWNGAFKAQEYPGVSITSGGGLAVNPEAIATKFGLRFAYWQITVPEGLPPEVREREEAKLRESFEAAESKITEMLYTGFQALVDHLVERLTPNEDGTKKKFSYSLFENLTEFIASFQNKNVFNDARLAEAVAKAQEIINTVGTPGMKAEDMAKRVRDYDAVRRRTAEAFEGLKQEVDKMVTDMPVRSFDFGE